MKENEGQQVEYKLETTPAVQPANIIEVSCGHFELFIFFLFQKHVLGCVTELVYIHKCFI